MLLYSLMVVCLSRFIGSSYVSKNIKRIFFFWGRHFNYIAQAYLKLFLFCWNRISLCYPDWPRPHCVDQAVQLYIPTCLCLPSVNQSICYCAWLSSNFGFFFFFPLHLLLGWEYTYSSVCILYIGHRRTCRNWSFPSATCILRTKLRLVSLVPCTFTY